MYATKFYATIDTSDPQFTEYELRRAASKSGGNSLLTIRRLYEGRQLNVKSFTRAARAVSSAVIAQAREANRRWHAFVLVSPAGNVSARTYLGREAAEFAASFSEGSRVIDLFGGNGLDLLVVTYFLELFPDNDALVNALLRRWARQIDYTPNTPASRDAAIAEGRQILAKRKVSRAKAEAWMAARSSQAMSA